MSERRRAKQNRRARRKTERDPHVYDERWTWQPAHRLAVGLRTGARVVYPVALEDRDRRLERFGMVIAELERIGLAFDVELWFKGEHELAVALIPRDCEMAA